MPGLLRPLRLQCGISRLVILWWNFGDQALNPGRFSLLGFRKEGLAFLFTSGCLGVSTRSHMTPCLRRRRRLTYGVHTCTSFLLSIPLLPLHQQTDRSFTTINHSCKMDEISVSLPTWQLTEISLTMTMAWYTLLIDHSYTQSQSLCVLILSTS